MTVQPDGVVYSSPEDVDEEKEFQSMLARFGIYIGFGLVRTPGGYPPTSPQTLTVHERPPAVDAPSSRAGRLSVLLRLLLLQPKEPRGETPDLSLGGYRPRSPRRFCNHGAACPVRPPAAVRRGGRCCARASLSRQLLEKLLTELRCSLRVV